MGLKYPADLDAWSKWQASSKPERRAKDFLRGFLRLANEKTSESNQGAANSVTGTLHLRGSSPRLLVVLDSTSPTSLSSLVRPLHFLDDVDIAVWAPEDVSAQLPDHVTEWRCEPATETSLDALTDVRAVMALGHYMGFGGAAYRLTQRTGARFVTVQHGLHTPYAPPLAPGTHLLAFSEADAHFWISDRTDVTYDVVGSQLFWDAAQKPKVDITELGEPVVFLGQMHGAELPRASFVRATLKFVKKHGAVYRPHPQEKDKLSRVVHALMKKMGVTIDESQQPLNQVNNPVVAIFSTGIIEAAIRGVPSWAYHPDPPEWLMEFWERYGMSQWGDSPTPSPSLPQIEPARSIATIITQQLEK
ncbi:RNA-binding protein [Rothia endophytica]|uniref:RNA-binding protein n=1 Tax=Rothia endophytica TaxID=1324766 RepID=UPI001F1D4AF4|nr:RNA-binding protein [Rothia endophytica]